MASRALVLGSLGTAHLLADHYGSLAHGSALDGGLLAWDASYYRGIAAAGYGAVERAGVRFFPLVPWLARVADRVLPGGTGPALIAVAWLFAFVFLVVIARLAAVTCEGEVDPRRVQWIAALWPGAFVTSLGYAESVFLALAAGALLAARRDRFVTAAVLAAAASVARPAGVLLAVPVFVSALRSRRPVVSRAVAVASAPAALLALLFWLRDRSGGLLEPVRIQQSSNLRGEPLDPFRAVAGAVSDAVADRRAGVALHLAAVAIVVALTVVVVRRFAAWQGAYTIAVVAVALASRNLDSFERYTLAAFPLLFAATRVLAGKPWARLAIAGSGALMGLYATAAFLGRVVP